MKVIHINRIEYLEAAGTFLDAYCALTVPDNVPFNPKDYEQEAQQFLDDNLYPPTERLINVIEKQYEAMLDNLLEKLKND